MKILDNLAINISNRVAAKNDEVMSLTQENERLQREYDAKAYTVKEIEDKLEDSEINLHNLRLDWDDLDKEYRRLESKYIEVKKRLKNLAESGERQVGTIQEYSERIIELEKEVTKLKKTKVSERYKLLKEASDKQLELIDTYEYISDSKNKSSVKDVFKHNLNVWMDTEGLANVKAAEILNVSDSAIAEWKNGRTALTVNSIQEVDLKLCEYFECSVYELVTVKMEGKK